MNSSTPRQPVSRRSVYSWAMYDWANSAYSTILITILVSWMQEDVFPDDTGIMVYGWGIGVTMLLSAVLLPVLGAIADAHASKHRWMTGTAFTGSASLLVMAVIPAQQPWVIAALFFTTNLCFEVSFAFSNGFLPELADEENMGRVSSLGYALGYLGGGLMLLLGILLLLFGDRVGLPADLAVRKRVVLALTGLWWALFTIPAALYLRDQGNAVHQSRSAAEAARRGLKEVITTLRSVRHYRTLAVFLLAFLMYNDGVQTMISQASVFAIKVLNMDAAELGQVILMIQFIALPAAVVVGRLGDRYGQKKTLLGCLIVWTLISISGWFITTRSQFWMMAVVAALVMGGTQTVSRAIMGLMTPQRHAAEFFGFFGLSGRATSMLGPVFFSTILYTTGSPHLAIASLVVFFVGGLAVVLPVDIQHGMQQAQRDSKHQPLSD